MRFDVTLLGCNAAIPANGHFLSGQVINIQEHWYMIDCGEWSQNRLSDLKIPRNRIGQIFISHLHGDHFFGLIGLITSYGLSGRQLPLEIFSPPGLREIIEIQLLYCGVELPFELRFKEIDTRKSDKIFSDEVVEVFTVPLRHRIPTAGFLFRERPFDRNILPEKIEEFQIPYDQIKAIKKGRDFVTPEGKQVPNAVLTSPPYKQRSYAYCSDTAYHEAIVPLIKGVDLLYHETTFTEVHRKEADYSLHATAKDAATIAQLAGAGKLITGHYSTRYQDLQVILDEALAVFPETVLGLDGGCYEVPLTK
jgi:ribonuclease Z